MEGVTMDRERFKLLLEAYGADLRRWPVDERAAAAAFKLQHGQTLAAELAEAGAIDAALKHGAAEGAISEALVSRIMAAHAAAREAAFDPRSWLALAACAVFGVLLGFGGGHLAPPAAAPAVQQDYAETYIDMAFEAPDFGEGG